MLSLERSTPSELETRELRWRGTYRSERPPSSARWSLRPDIARYGKTSGPLKLIRLLPHHQDVGIRRPSLRTLGAPARSPGRARYIVRVPQGRRDRRRDIDLTARDDRAGALHRSLRRRDNLSRTSSSTPTTASVGERPSARRRAAGPRQFDRGRWRLRCARRQSLRASLDRFKDGDRGQRRRLRRPSGGRSRWV